MIKVFYEDADIIAINKPEGIRMHEDDNENLAPTVYSLLVQQYPFLEKINNPYSLQKRKINLGGIVHRLDRDTSGVLLIAKTENTFEHLKDAFKNQKVVKKYVAIIHGYITCDISIDIPLGRKKKSFLRAQEGSDARGPYVSAQTLVRPLAYNKEKDLSLVQLEPLTGRTHQLRAHLSFLEHPILGDILYGEKDGSPRLFLHAHSIELDGKKYTSPLPEEFKRLFDFEGEEESPRVELLS